MTAVDISVIGLGFMGARWARCIAEHPRERSADAGVVVALDGGEGR